MTDAPSSRVLAEATDYRSLLDAFRARAAELGITRHELDEISGLADGYASKLLAPIPMKSFGRTSLGPLLGALGVRLAIVEDADQRQKIEERIARRRISAGREMQPWTSVSSIATINAP